MNDLFSESIHRRVDEYLLAALGDRDPLFLKMEQYGLDRKFPLIGPLAGNALSFLVRAIGAKTVFELGSGYGYSAVHFARALPEEGKVICTDGDPANEKAARQFFSEAGVLHKTEYHVGDAVTTLKKFAGPFDIILMDIDKAGYPAAFSEAWPKIRHGGLFIADNLLWHGRVMSEDHQPSTEAIREFTRLIHRAPGAQSMIIPLRDGLSVTMKLA